MAAAVAGSSEELCAQVRSATHTLSQLQQQVAVVQRMGEARRRTERDGTLQWQWQTYAGGECPYTTTQALPLFEHTEPSPQFANSVLARRAQDPRHQQLRSEAF